MPINKIIYEDNVLIDLTEDTVTPDTLVKGVTAHDKAGNIITGTHECAGGGEGAVIKTAGGWQGTTVPNTGYVENVYFNTELSVEEVVAILETAKNNSGTDTVITYGSNELTIIKIVDSTLTPSYCWYIGNFSTFEIYFSSADNHEYANFAGWNASFGNVLEINSEVGQGSVDNSLLSALFSTTPFVKSEAQEVILEGEYDGSTIEIKELPKGGWEGTPVPSDGSLVDIYVNTDLSNEEVLNMIESLGLEQYQQYYVYKFERGSGYDGIFIEKDYNNNYNVHCNHDGHNIVIWTTSTSSGYSGWQDLQYVDNPLTFTSYEGTPIALSDNQNDKLATLFSITLFVKSEPNTIDMKRYIKYKKIPLNIKVNVPGGGEAGGSGVQYEKLVFEKNYPVTVNDSEIQTYSCQLTDGQVDNIDGLTENPKIIRDVPSTIGMSLNMGASNGDEIMLCCLTFYFQRSSSQNQVELSYKIPLFDTVLTCKYVITDDNMMYLSSVLMNDAESLDQLSPMITGVWITLITE